MKSVQMRSFSWSVFSRIWTEYREKCRKIRTRKNSVFRHFSRSVSKWKISYTVKSVISLSSQVKFYKRFSFTLNYIRFLSVFGTLRVAVNQISQDPVCTPQCHNECASLDNVLQKTMINQYSSNKKYSLWLRVTLSIICVLSSNLLSWFCFALDVCNYKSDVFRCFCGWWELYIVGSFLNILWNWQQKLIH